MKKIILLSLCAIALLNSCVGKTDIAPEPIKLPPPAGKSSVVKLDTIPDGAILKVRLQMDSTQIDETLLKFDHDAGIDYSNSRDAVYFQGFGVASLSSVSDDGVPCAIQTLPYLSGNPIRLKVGVKKDGIYLLKISYANNIPQDKNIWLKDAYKQDSLNLRLWNYRFNVFKTDTNTFGARRFTIVIR